MANAGKCTAITISAVSTLLQVQASKKYHRHEEKNSVIRDKLRNISTTNSRPTAAKKGPNYVQIDVGVRATP